MHLVGTRPRCLEKNQEEKQWVQHCHVSNNIEVSGYTSVGYFWFLQEHIKGIIITRINVHHWRTSYNHHFCVNLPPLSFALAPLAVGSWMQQTGRRLLSQIGLPVRSVGLSVRLACPHGRTGLKRPDHHGFYRSLLSFLRIHHPQTQKTWPWSYTGSRRRASALDAQMH